MKLCFSIILILVSLAFSCRAPVSELQTKDEDRPAIEIAVREFYAAPHKKEYPSDIEQPVNVIGIQLVNKAGDARIAKVDIQTRTGDRQMRTVHVNAFNDQNGKYWKVNE